jgi:hypothetical protein
MARHQGLFCECFILTYESFGNTISSQIQGTTMAISTEKEHEVSYSYPTSASACKHGFGKTGCYTIKAGGGEVAVMAKEEALATVAASGTKPSRWSIDNPLNK